MRAAAVCVAALVLAGCGGATKHSAPPVPPRRIPHALAHAWAAQAQAVARSLAAGDGCAAVQQATALREAVSGAEGSVPVRYRGALTAAVDALPGRITCTPPPPAPAPHEHPHPHAHPPHDHGHGPGGDQG